MSKASNKNPQDLFLTFLSEGKWMFNKGEYHQAANSFTAALNLRPGDKKCLIGRAKCYMKMGRFENVFTDVEETLKDDKSFIEGLYLKAEALYHTGNVEQALVFHSRGLKLQPHMQKFRLGAQCAQQAIEDTAGSEKDLSFLYKDERKKNNQTPKTDKTNKALLGKFYHDKKFLEDLMKDEELVGSETIHGERLQDIIQDCLTSLDTCAKLWSLEKPVAPQQQKRRGPSEQAQFVLKSLNEIDNELTRGNAEASLKKAKRAMSVVQTWTTEDIPNKYELLGSLHSYIGRAFFILGDMDEALEHHRTDLQLAERCKLPEATSRALNNMGVTLAQTGQFAQAVEFWEQMIPLVDDGLEKAWLFHNIGSSSLNMKQYEEAKHYGIRCLAAAEEAADEKWQLNGNVLIAQAELKTGNVESSVSHFEKASSLARLTEDEAALGAIQKALNEAKQLLPDGEHL
ncbi:outer dynein arm-docking complex subunit 4 isoform X1 [Nothobranchius furzeri]|uniref:Outer dynein arm-docking complex subunit 4 n=2 Tax=Nothobranchius furzeri TaxID=105023 RepID=A0A1A8TY31_NOTFU|nr:transcript variant X1 [Nothobranchius furzeri]